MNGFEASYPAITRWIKREGWIEIGDDGLNRSFVRVLDEGGMIWEGGDRRMALDDLFRELESAVAAAIREIHGQ